MNAISRRDAGLIISIALLSMLGFVLASRLIYRPGFPLDDAWIHQTYARNLAVHGEWAYLPGEPSAGSTAPAWSALLAIGYLLRLNPQLWAFLLGWALLAGIGLVGAHAMRWLAPEASRWGIWAGLGLVLEWHMVWAALSGMETLLYVLVVLLILVWLVRQDRRSAEQETAHASLRTWLGLGALVGFAAWVRPDAITLLAPVGLFIILSGNSIRQKAVGLLACLVGCALFIVPYLFFNLGLAGAWLPNTFFAKQAEYAVHREIPFWTRLMDQFKLPLVGVGAILFPAFSFLMVRAGLRRSAGLVLGGLWALGYLGLYAWRLPVTYQHGRYIMPAMPVFFLWGAAGLVALWLSAKLKWPRLLVRAWALSTGLVLMFFWLIGAKAYALDVAIIESEMVDTARWVQQNTSHDAVIAAHDIGALGYFAQRPLVDLAGLVSPEVIPFVRDETAIQAYLDQSHVEYLVTFPAWYPSLVRQAPVLYVSAGEFSPRLDGENMTVFLWK